MIKTVSSSILLAVAASMATFGLANADCKLQSPGTMYLGDGGSYSLHLFAHRREACAISFSSQAEGVDFSSVDVLSQPKSGKFSNKDTYSLFYSPPASGDRDSFSLKICGKDTHGTGCNTLNYTVTVSE